MKIVLLDSATLGQYDERIFKELGNFIPYTNTKQEDVVERAKDVSVILTNKVRLDSTILSQLPKLKLICITATGTNNVDLDKAKELNIEVKNVIGYSTKSVAQHTMMLALSLLGRLPYYSQYVKSGEWTKSDIFCHLPFDLIDLYKREWGIIGLGNIGSQVAKLAGAFGANISYHSTSGENMNSPYTHKSLKELLATSDIISIHAPLSDKTYNLIKKEELELLKNGAILLNLGRGGIINELDLANILKHKDIYFGGDVLEIEPMIENHPLLDKEIARKMLLTPHIAWAYKDSKEKLIQLVADNIKAFLGK